MHKELICRRWVTNKDGSRRYPPPGKRAICFWVDVEDQLPTFPEMKNDLDSTSKSL